MSNSIEVSATETIKINELFFNEFVTVASCSENADLIGKMLGGHFMAMMHFEPMIYHSAKKASPESDVALWKFGETKNKKSLIMFPSSEDSFLVSNSMNYSESRVDSRIFGIMISLITINHASWFFHEKGDEKAAEIYSNLYHSLSDSFYSLVDKLAYSENSIATEEDKAQISAMSSAVYSFLD